MCYLRKDYKTYDYIKKYIKCIGDHVKKCMIENEIQAHEILVHLDINNVCEDMRNREALNWIKRNGRPMRDYLETMYRVAVKYKDKMATYEQFCYAIDEFNRDKG